MPNTLSEDFLKQLEKRVHEKKKPRFMKRSRKSPCRFIDSQAKERKHDEEKAAQKKKEKKKSNASKKGKRKRDDLHEESDDESVGRLVSKHCKRAKRFGVRKSYEQAKEREAKARFFIDSDDEESVNGEESMIKRVEEKATEPSLLGGDEISSKIESDRAKHREENRLTKRIKTSRGLAKMRKDRNVRNSMKNSNNTNCNNVINNNYHYNISVGSGTGLGSAPYYPHHPNVQPFPSIQNHQYPYMIGQYQQYQAPVHRPLMLQPPYQQYHPASGNVGYSAASSLMSQLDHLVLKFRNTHKDERDKKWLRKFMQALAIHQKHRGSLRGGYNSVDNRMYDWYSTQRRNLQSLSQAKRDLLNMLG